MRMRMFHCFRPTIIFTLTTIIASIVILILVIPGRFKLNSNVSKEIDSNASHHHPHSSSDDGRCLDRNTFFYNNSAAQWTTATDQTNHHCQLHLYSLSDVVTCINSINNIYRAVSLRRQSHFVFIGDSRARQQFFNFIKLIPKYDFIFDPEWDNYDVERGVDLHIDRSVTSDLLCLKVSFFWRPYLNEEWIDPIHEWLEHPPYFVLISVGIWHFSNGYDDRLELLREMLNRLSPSFRRLLANKTELIWMNQYPLLPLQRFFPPKRDDTSNSENFQTLNNIVRNIFKDSGVKFWDSGNPAVEEHSRSCESLQQITDRQLVTYRSYRDAYFDCNDRVHPGYVALSQPLQILLNHLCNRLLFNLPFTNKENKFKKYLIF